MKILIICLLLLTSKSFANACDGLKVARVLDGLLNVGQIYNCKLEVVRLETKIENPDDSITEMISYLVYGKDVFRCKTSARICPKANFELSLPKKCFLSEEKDKAEIRYSSGYNIDGSKLRNHINIKKSDKQIQLLSFGQTELESGKRVNYVQCQLEIFGGDNEN